MLGLLMACSIASPICLPALRVDGLNHGDDVTEDEAPALGDPSGSAFGRAVVRVDRHVIGHDHVRIAHVGQGLGQPVHVHIPLVGPHLLEAVQPPSDVSEVDIEDLLPLTEVPDDVVELGPRVLQAL